MQVTLIQPSERSWPCDYCRTKGVYSEGFIFISIETPHGAKALCEGCFKGTALEMMKALKLVGIRFIQA